jgi:hypothetical protein
MQENGSNGSTQKQQIHSEEMRSLDPKKIELTRDAFDHVRLVVDDEVHEKVKIARAFPVSMPDRYISFMTHEGKEIGMVEDMKRLDSSQRRIVEEELDTVYLTPIIQTILTVSSQHGSTTWRVKTDRGETTVYVKDRGEIRRLPGRRILFTDVHGMKYDVPDYAKLDDRSRSLIDNEI